MRIPNDFFFPSHTKVCRVQDKEIPNYFPLPSANFHFVHLYLRLAVRSLTHSHSKQFIQNRCCSNLFWIHLKQYPFSFRVMMTRHKCKTLFVKKIFYLSVWMKKLWLHVVFSFSCLLSILFFHFNISENNSESRAREEKKKKTNREKRNTFYDE